MIGVFIMKANFIYVKLTRIKNEEDTYLGSVFAHHIVCRLL